MAHGENAPLNITPGAIRFNTDSMKLEYFRIGMEGGDSSSYAGIGTLAAGEWVQITTDSPDIQTGGTRGLFMGGFIPGPTTYDVVDYINVDSTGNAIDFGDFTAGTRFGAACSSSTRALYGGGVNPSVTATIEFFTISSTGDATDFGDLTDSRQGNSAGSSSTRGIWTGGYDPTTKDVIDYVTIASTGDAKDFGNLTTSRKQQLGTACSSVRCVQGGSEGGASDSNVLDYITTATLGDAADFGDLTSGGDSAGANGGCSNSVRGLFAFGRSGPALVNTIDYITIATLGNAIDFGDTAQAQSYGAVASPTRGVFAFGSPSSNDINYVQIMSTGDAVDFGDLTVARSQLSACSNGHGGLG